MSFLNKIKYGTIYRSLSAVAVILLLASAGVGAVHLSFGEIFDFFLNAIGIEPNALVNPVHKGLFFHIRLPRTVLCFIVGSTLSVSGALMQSVFRNPIVEPGLVGTSAGAALGASITFVFGQAKIFSQIQFLGDLLLPVCAFAGGLAATAIVYGFSSSFGKVNVSTMILAGVAVNAMAAGGTGFLSYIARDPQARSITFWSLGTFSGADWKQVIIVLIVSLTCILIVLRYAKDLNALQLGETEAGYLGFNAERMKFNVILLNTLMVSVATSMVGVISFVGLTVPHLLRIMKGSDTRYLMIGSALLGGILMITADMLARVLIAPAEMPIGIITAFVGGPVFLWLLLKNLRTNRKGGFYA